LKDNNINYYKTLAQNANANTPTNRREY